MDNTPRKTIEQFQCFSRVLNPLQHFDLSWTLTPFSSYMERRSPYFTSFVWRFFPVSSSLNNFSTSKSSADFGASYATRYTRTLRLAETVLTRLVTCIWFSGPFALLSNSAPTASLQTIFYHHNFIGIACTFAIVTSTRAGRRLVHFVARAFTRNTENLNGLIWLRLFVTVVLTWNFWNDETMSRINTVVFDKVSTS